MHTSTALLKDDVRLSEWKGLSGLTQVYTMACPGSCVDTKWPS